MAKSPSKHTAGPSNAWDDSSASRRTRESPAIDLPMWICVAVGLLLVAWLYGDFGITWDESIQATYGEETRAYFLGGDAGAAGSSVSPNMRYYGPLPDLIPSLLYGSDESNKYDIRHLWFGLVTALVLPAMWKIGRLFKLSAMPVLAAGSIVMLPQFSGHAFNNGKDMPFAVAMTWFMYSMMNICVRKRWCWRDVLFAGAMMGLVLCTRPGGLPVVLVLAAVSLAIARLTGERSEGGALMPHAWWVIATKSFAAFALAWVIMVLPWPFAHQSPLLNPIEAMRFAVSFPDSYPVLFEGREYQSTALPWYYVLKHLCISTPPSLLVLLLVGLAVALWTVSRNRASGRACLSGILIAWLALPIALFAVLRPNMYDGIRHALFLQPPIALLSALGGSWLIEWACRRAMMMRAAVIGCVVGATVLPVVSLVRLHPYQMTYFNFLVGGLRGAAGRYETDYWASSYREAMLWINTQAIRDPDRTLTVLVGGGGFLEPAVRYDALPNVQIHMIRDDPGLQELPPMVDYLVSTTRYGLGWRLFPKASIVHVVERDGAVFTIIKGR